MKYKIKYIFITLIVTFMVGCNDGFLDRFPDSSINNSIFWNSESDMKLYNNALYAGLFNGSMKFFNKGQQVQVIVLEAQSDNIALVPPGPVRTGDNIATATDIYWDWTLIRKINYFLENYSKANVADNIKNIYAAEARLMRALDYFMKMKRFGDLPLVDKVLNETDDQLMAARVPREQIVDFIMSDLDFATQWLPVAPENERLGKYAALGFEARIALYEGTYRKYRGLANADALLTKASDAALAVINSGKYAINKTSNYNALFGLEDLRGNKEVLFYEQYVAGLITHNYLGVFKSTTDLKFGGTKSLVNAYLCKDGLPISQSPLYVNDDNITNEFTNRDERLKNTIGLPGTYFVNSQLDIIGNPGKTGGDEISTTGYTMVKFYNPNEENVGWDNSYTDAPLLRYAEVLLDYAEAKAELGTATQADIDLSINELRKKAKVADMVIANLVKDVNSDFPGISVLIDEIRRERRVELVMEGQRYDDLIRWKAGKILEKSVLGLKFNKTDILNYSQFVIGVNIKLDSHGYINMGVNAKFDENKNYLFPIPLNELGLNPNIGQNPGW